MMLLIRDQANERKGIEKGILGMISALRDLNVSEDIILQKVQEKFSLSEEEAKEYMQEP